MFSLPTNNCMFYRLLQLAAEQQREDEQEMRRVAECREEKEKKLEHARRAKEAIEENPDAFRKSKWPCCTQ
jgi:hypothetical protein